MQLKSLKLFCDIVGRRSFSRAADDNGISQSGASQIVHQMEDHLGVKLIDRSKRPFVLTPEGEAYYQGCRKLVQRYDALEEEVRTLHQEVAGRVAVASIYSVGLSYLSHYVQEFLGKNPKANIRLEYHHPQQVYDLVENDQMDIGLVSYPKSSRSIKATAWRVEPMVLACAPSHPLARKASIQLEDLGGFDVVGFDHHLMIRREIDRALAAKNVEVNVVMQLDNIETIKRAIEIDTGVGLLPAPTVERELTLNSLVAVPIADPHFVRPVGIIERRGKEFGKTARRFIQLLLEKADLESSPGSNPDHKNNGHSSGRTSDGPDLAGAKSTELVEQR